MGQIRPGVRHAIHVVVTGLKSKRDADRLKKAIAKVVAKFKGKVSHSRRAQRPKSKKK